MPRRRLIFSCVYAGGAFAPCTKGARERADEAFGEGEIVELELRDDRSEKAHRHLFAFVGESYRSLPDATRERLGGWAANVDVFRAWVQIRAGVCDVGATFYDSSSDARAAARGIAAALRTAGVHAMTQVRGLSVTTLTPKSLAYGAMGKRDFDAAQAAMVEVCADLLGADPADVRAMEELA